MFITCVTDKNITVNNLSLVYFISGTVLLGPQWTFLDFYNTRTLYKTLIKLLPFVNYIHLIHSKVLFS